MHRFTQTLAAFVLALVVMGVLTTGAQAALLSDFVDPTTGDSNGNTFTNGNLVFSAFFYHPPTGPPPASAVTVNAFTDPFGNKGNEFGGGFVNPVPDSTIDLRFGYTVTSSDGKISDVHLAGNPAVLPPGGTSFVSLTETVSAPGVGPLGQLSIFAVPDGMGGTTLKLSDTLNLAQGYQSLIIQKDLVLFNQTETPDHIPQISIIDQSFSIPEPTSLALLGMGVVGMYGLYYRRRGRVS
jgi:hypothetical protein